MPHEMSHEIVHEMDREILHEMHHKIDRHQLIGNSRGLRALYSSLNWQ
jgi:hypothetical protein